MLRLLDAVVATMHGRVVDRSGLHPRGLAIMTGWSTLVALLLFLVAAAHATGETWFGWLLVPFAAGVVLHVQGIRSDGPPRPLAGDLVSRLMSTVTTLVVLIACPVFIAVSGLATPFLIAVLPPLLWTATLYFEALPLPHRRARKRVPATALS